MVWFLIGFVIFLFFIGLLIVVFIVMVVLMDLYGVSVISFSDGKVFIVELIFYSKFEII